MVRRLTIDPEGPTDIRLSGGRIRGQVRSADGPVPAVVYLDHQRFEFPGGRVDIRGVPAGPHFMIVGAKGHLGEVRRIVMGENEEREVQIELPKR